MTRACPHAGDQLVPALRAVGAARPTAPALLLGDGAVSYAQLWRAADDLASRLPSSGRVGLCLSHGRDVVVGILATLVAGCSYVPLDPAWPAGRLAVMAGRAALAAVVGGHVSVAPSVSHVAWPGRADDPDAATAVRLGTPSDGETGDASEAYVLFTSGSTGGPKGVAQTRRAVLTCARNQVASLGLTPDDRLTLLTSFGYDMAVVDLFSALLAGAAVVPWDVATRGLHGLPEHLTATGATIYHSSPTLLRHLLSLDPAPVPSMRLVLTGGEPVSGADVVAVREWLGDGVEFVNGYGATEASFVAHHHVLPADAPGGGNLPCGRPLPGYDIVVVDPDERGVGELELRGHDVARGWLGRDGEGARHAFGLADGVPFHRPGDLGRIDADGVLHHHGRRDRRVKLNGVRLELAEVELALLAVPGVSQAAVRGVGEPPTGLVAWVEPAPGANLDPEEVRTAVRDVLPAAGVPSRVHVGPIPRTASGKLDRAALAATTPDAGAPDVVPAAANPEGDQATDPSPAPMTPVEREVAAAYAEALGRTAVPLHAGLFELGGSSLTAATIHARLASTPLGAGLALTDVMSHPSAAALAAHLTRHAPDDASPRDGGSSSAGTSGDADDALTRARLRAQRRAQAATGRSR